MRMLISEGQNIAIKSAEMVLSDLTWKSVKKGPPVIQPTVGDHKGQGRVSGEHPAHAACVDAPPTTSCHGGVEGGAARCRRFCCYSFTEGSQVSEAPSCSSALLGLISLPSAHLAQLAAPLFRVTVQRGPASLDISHTMWVFNTRSLTKMRWCPRVLASEPGLLGSRHGMMAFHQTGQLRHASHCNHTSDPSDEGLRQDRSAHPTCAELSWLPPGGPPGAHSRTACSKQTADIYRHPGH